MVETYKPKTLKEALTIRTSGALPFAGGTDLMVARKSYSGNLPKFDTPLLFTDGIVEMKTIKKDAASLRIGGAVTMAEALEHPEVPELLKEAMKLVAAPGIRNRATLGGNICNASPAGDSLVPLYILDAKVVLTSLEGERQMPLADFITGVRRLNLSDGELLTEIIIPDSNFDKTDYRKVGTRRANALSKLSFTAALSLDGDKISDLRIALGAVAPTVVRKKEIESQLNGKSLSEIDPAKAAALWAPFITPIDDQRSTAAYRKKVALNLITEFLTKTKETI